MQDAAPASNAPRHGRAHGLARKKSSVQARRMWHLEDISSLVGGILDIVRRKRHGHGAPLTGCMYDIRTSLLEKEGEDARVAVSLPLAVRSIHLRERYPFGCWRCLCSSRSWRFRSCRGFPPRHMHLTSTLLFKPTLSPTTTTTKAIKVVMAY